MHNFVAEPLLHLVLTMCHNGYLNLTICALFCLISRVGVVHQSSPKFPWVLRGKGAGADREGQHRIWNFLLKDFEGSALTSALVICASLSGQSRWEMPGLHIHDAVLRTHG